MESYFKFNTISNNNFINIEYSEINILINKNENNNNKKYHIEFIPKNEITEETLDQLLNDKINQIYIPEYNLEVNIEEESYINVNVNNYSYIKDKRITTFNVSIECIV